MYLLHQEYLRRVRAKIKDGLTSAQEDLKAPSFIGLPSTQEESDLKVKEAGQIVASYNSAMKYNQINNSSQGTNDSLRSHFI